MASREGDEQALEDDVGPVAQRAPAGHGLERGEDLIDDQEREREQETVARRAAHLPVGTLPGESHARHGRHRSRPGFPLLEPLSQPGRGLLGVGIAEFGFDRAQPLDRELPPHRRPEGL